VIHFQSKIMSDPAPTPSETPNSGVKERFLTLHATCSQTLENSFGDAAGSAMAQSYLFANDLQAWTQYLADRPENALFRLAEQEYVAALLSLVCGQYRSAFKGLRLVLELLVQGTYLSANLIELNEWLRSSKDTNWSILIGAQQEAGTEESAAAARGPFTKRFSDAFFPEVRNHASSFATMARTLYRELSETIHGNMPKAIPLPPSFEFDADTFLLWHAKAGIARMIGLFCLTCRYAVHMDEASRSSVEAGVFDQLGHIEAIRTLFGGPSTV
jgi:hypothetical protein